MKMLTENHKKAKEFLQSMDKNTNLLKSYESLRHSGKNALDDCMLQMGRMLAGSIMLMEREELSGADYYHKDDYQKWVWQQGSGGLLRRANRLATGVLIAAAGEGCQVVSADHVRVASTEVI